MIYLNEKEQGAQVAIAKEIRRRENGLPGKMRGITLGELRALRGMMRDVRRWRAVRDVAGLHGREVDPSMVIGASAVYEWSIMSTSENLDRAVDGRLAAISNSLN